jgi:Ca-activated chloride channel family protein
VRCGCGVARPVVEQLYPQEMPDLFAGTQLVLTGRYREGGPATITLTGEVNGEKQTFVYEDNTFRSNGGDDFIPRLWATRAIGHLLTQIRLHGEDAELVQSVVNLSIRYGIITPYTSYLIEEDDIFTQSGRDNIVEEAEEAFALPREVSGGEAVDAAAEQGTLADAEAPLPAPGFNFTAPDGSVVNSAEVVRQVGSKTFIFRNGVWIDTAYNADEHTPQQLGFASDAYFELLTAAPEIGQFLSLGSQVLFVYGGQVYQTVEGEGQTNVTLPDVQPTDIAPTNGEPQSPSDSSGSDSGRGIGCSAAMLPLMLIGLAGLTRRRKT